MPSSSLSEFEREWIDHYRSEINRIQSEVEMQSLQSYLITLSTENDLTLFKPRPPMDEVVYETVELKEGWEIVSDIANGVHKLRRKRGWGYPSFIHYQDGRIERIDDNA